MKRTRYADTRTIKSATLELAVSSQGRNAQRIQDQIRRVLRNDWNPLGRFGIEIHPDEYDGYIGGVYRRLARGVPARDIAAHLARLEVDAMGLPTTDPARLLPVAEKLKRLDLLSPRRRDGR